MQQHWHALEPWIPMRSLSRNNTRSMSNILTSHHIVLPAHLGPQQMHSPLATPSKVSGHRLLCAPMTRQPRPQKGRRSLKSSSDVEEIASGNGCSTVGILVHRGKEQAQRASQSVDHLFATLSVPRKWSFQSRHEVQVDWSVAVRKRETTWCRLNSPTCGRCLSQRSPLALRTSP